jgi:hypothetical protein
MRVWNWLHHRINALETTAELALAEEMEKAVESVPELA